MHIIIKTAASLGVLLTICNGAAWADWEETKARVLAYHDKFNETALTFDGTSELKSKSFGRTQGCTITYRFEGRGSDLGVVVSKPLNSNISNMQACRVVSARTQRVVGQGISITGREVRQLLSFLEFDETLPEQIKETNDSVTYRLDAGASGPENTQNTGEIVFEMEFSKPEGRFISLKMFGESEEKNPDEDQSMKAKMRQGSDFDALPNGQPYIAMTFYEDEGEITGDGQRMSFENSLRLTFTNVVVLSDVADNQSSEVQSVSLETGNAPDAQGEESLRSPLHAFALRPMDEVIESAWAHANKKHDKSHQ